MIYQIFHYLYHKLIILLSLHEYRSQKYGSLSSLETNHIIIKQFHLMKLFPTNVAYLYYCMTYLSNPPENCQLNVKKLPKNLTFFQKN